MNNKNKIKVGLLPLYIKLYDDFSSHMRSEIENFYQLITEELKIRGLEVFTSEICRIESEFDEAVKKFKIADIDALITLHLAYSPSLESSEILKNADIPIIVLDTTPDYIYDGETDPEKLSYNHGIHGVQDMCNLLRRNKVKYTIFAGHWKYSDVLDRTVNAAKGAKIAKIFKNSKAGIVGEPFKGMGDFNIDYNKLKNLLGIEVVEYNLKNEEYNVSNDEIEKEYVYDLKNYDLKNVTKDIYIETVPTELKIRKWIEDKNLNSFTINFLSTSKNGPLPYMPFSAAGKAMRDGIGYAGEGDILTSVLVGALLSEYEYTSFTEMFCPDWNGNTVFLSHMGEQNLKCVDGKAAMIHKNFPYTTAGKPTALYGTFKAGKVIFTCIAPQADDKFMLIVAEGEMIKAPCINKHIGDVNGWFKPKKPIIEFLEDYSKLGGIHHAALIYDGDIGTLKQFAFSMNFDYMEI